MAQVDSLDKVIGTYFSGITAVPFFYKKKLYRPKTIVVSPTLVRGFTCPVGCAGCCPRFSLDYIPGEETPYPLRPRAVTFDSRQVVMMSDPQTDHKRHHCRNVKSDGRCGIHGKQPFSCDFELIRFVHELGRVNITQRLFGRGWQMLRVDGERGALCEMNEPDEETVADVVRKLERLDRWTRRFGLKTRIDQVLEWCHKGPPFERLEIPA